MLVIEDVWAYLEIAHSNLFTATACCSWTDSAIRGESGWLHWLVWSPVSRSLLLLIIVAEVVGECDRAAVGCSQQWFTEIQSTLFDTCKSRMNQAENVPATPLGCTAPDTGVSNLIGGKARKETFVLRRIITPRQGIHHSDKGWDNISRAFKDGRKSITGWDKKWVMLMSFCFFVFAPLFVFIYDVGSGPNPKLPKARSCRKVWRTNLKDDLQVQMWLRWNLCCKGDKGRAKKKTKKKNGCTGSCGKRDKKVVRQWCLLDLTADTVLAGL